jgi:hypothetical protein
MFFTKNVYNESSPCTKKEQFLVWSTVIYYKENGVELIDIYKCLKLYDNFENLVELFYALCDLYDDLEVEPSIYIEKNLYN